MKITNLSKLIGMIGLIVIVVSIVQWFFLYPDTSQLALGCGIGITFVGFAYIHTWMRKTADDIRDLNEGMDAFRVWAVDELEKKVFK